MRAPEKTPPRARRRSARIAAVAAWRGGLAALLVAQASPVLGQSDAPGAPDVRGKVHLKNNTAETVRCRLSRENARDTPIVLRPGDEYAERFDFETQLSLQCPKLQKKPYGPLVPGRRYDLLPAAHGVTLFEATGADFAG